MKFSEIIDQATALLQRKGRVSYRALKREFELDDAASKDLTDELADIQELARDKDRKLKFTTGSAKALILMVYNQRKRYYKRWDKLSVCSTCMTNS